MGYLYPNQLKLHNKKTFCMNFRFRRIFVNILPDYWGFSSPIILPGLAIISIPFVDYTAFNIDISNIELVRVHGRVVNALVLRAKGVSFFGFESHLVPTFFFNSSFLVIYSSIYHHHLSQLHSLEVQ